MKKLLLTLVSVVVCAYFLNLFISNNFVHEVAPSIPSTVTNTPQRPIKNNNATTYAPIVIDNTTAFETTWFPSTTDGNIQINATYNQQDITVISAGTNLSSSQLYRDGVSFQKGHHYAISLNVSSSIVRDIEIVLSNADTGIVYANQRFPVTDNSPVYFPFEMTQDTIWNGRVSIQVGNDGKADTANQHTLKLSSMKVTNLDNYDHTVKVNQIGYLTNSQKQCVFPYSQGDSFNVVHAETKEVVYTGAITHKIINDKTGETNFLGDFTNVVTPGKYYIESQLIGTSYEFEIGTHLFDNHISSLIHMLTLQRCSSDLDHSYAKDLAHASCHNQDSILYTTPDVRLDTRGGWHDAGDFGRFVKTGTKSVNDLLLAFIVNPDKFNDASAIKESGNAIPDVLDEARYEIEWLLKMQSSWGAVFSKTVTPNLPGNISPENDNQTLYTLDAETTTTADFIASTALASITYESYDADFSTRCLEAAKKAWENLINTPDFIEHSNPSDITAGEYRDEKDTDERFFAGVALWAATKDRLYLDYATTVLANDPSASTGLSWKDVGTYGTYIYLIFEEDQSAPLYVQLNESLKNEAELLAGISYGDGYRTSMITYSWGSNGTVAEGAVLFMMAATINNNQDYRQLAIENINYLFGKNSLNMSFVTNTGQQSPKNPHHRTAIAKTTLLPGALVGGPNADRDDAITKELSATTPSAKMYVDKFDSYSTNEVAIYWNSALIHALSYLE